MISFPCKENQLLQRHRSFSLKCQPPPSPEAVGRQRPACQTFFPSRKALHCLGCGENHAPARFRAPQWKGAGQGAGLSSQGGAFCIVVYIQQNASGQVFAG